MIKNLIPHVCIIFSLATLTLLILAQFNPIMSNSFVQLVIAVTGIAGIVTAAFLIASSRKR